MSLGLATKNVLRTNHKDYVAKDLRKAMMKWSELERNGQNLKPSFTLLKIQMIMQLRKNKRILSVGYIKGKGRSIITMLIFIHFPFLKLVNTIIKKKLKSTKTKHLAMPAYIFMLA